MVVQIRGKTYHTVADRLTQAHGDQGKPTGIQCITTEPVAVGDTVLVKATITFADGRQFCGMAEVITTSSGAQATNPVECAETSAVGRALAMAGYFGSGDGIAGAEEVRAATRPQNGHAASHRPRATTPQRSRYDG